MRTYFFLCYWSLSRPRHRETLRFNYRKKYDQLSIEKEDTRCRWWVMVILVLVQISDATMLHHSKFQHRHCRSFIHFDTSCFLFLFILILHSLLRKPGRCFSISFSSHLFSTKKYTHMASTWCQLPKRDITHRVRNSSVQQASW